MPGRTPTGETRVKAGHVVRRADGTVVKELKPTPLASVSGGMSRFAGISLAGMPAGEYELIVNVTDEVRGETVTVHEPFALAGCPMALLTRPSPVARCGCPLSIVAA